MTLNRLCLILLASSGAVWLLSFILGWQQKREEQAYYAQHVLPKQEAQKREQAAFEEALARRKRGEKVPLPALTTEPTASLTTLVERRNEQLGTLSLRYYSGMAFMATLVGWTFASMIQVERMHRRRAAPDRPADPGAGSWLEPFRREGERIVARAERSGPLFSVGGCREIEIDPRRGTVSFVGCTFVTGSGFGSKRRDERVEMPLADILGVRLDHHGGQSLLTVRTTQGTVTIGNHIEPFQLVAEVLFDAVEVNRASPENYRAALAREPAMRTPWYGWAILVGGVGVVVGGLLWVAVH